MGLPFKDGSVVTTVTIDQQSYEVITARGDHWLVARGQWHVKLEAPEHCLLAVKVTRDPRGLMVVAHGQHWKLDSIEQFSWIVSLHGNIEGRF